MDYYSLLGVQRGASADEIKKAYRKASMKHHPDRGGDESQFKKINEAYDVLSDPQKRQMHDMGVDPNRQHQGGGHHRSGPFEFHFNSGNFDDIFGGFGFGRQRQQRNKSVNITVSISLEDLIHGKTVHAEVSMPTGRSKILNIDIPKGIQDGQQIRYQGMGDDGIPGIPPGDLIVNIHVMHHPKFIRQGDDLIVEENVSVWDCILGGSITIETVDRKRLNINVPEGCQPGTVMRVTGEGIPNVRSHRRGNLLVKIKTTIPKNLTQSQKEKIKSIKGL